MVVAPALKQAVLACQISTADRLEVNDDVSDLQVPLFFQVSEDSGPEEDLTLADAEQVAVQLQGLNLRRRGQDTDEAEWRY